MSSDPCIPADRPPMLLEVLRARLRARRLRTERAYTHWVARFVRFTGRRHPRDCGAAEVGAFLSELAVKEDQWGIVLELISAPACPLHTDSYQHEQNSAHPFGWRSYPGSPTGELPAYGGPVGWVEERDAASASSLGTLGFRPSLRPDSVPRGLTFAARLSRVAQLGRLHDPGSA